MLGGSVSGWLSLETTASCPDFALSARAGVLALERELHPSCISCAVLDARAWDWPLGRGCVSDARAGSWELERRPGSANVLGECILRSSGRLAARAEVCEWPLERGVLRSSGDLG